MGRPRVKTVETAIEPENMKKIEEAEKPFEQAIEAVDKADSKKKKTKKEGPKKIRSKRYLGLVEGVDKTKLYDAKEAIELVKKTSKNKFDATIEAHVNLNLQADKQEHQIRTGITLPHQAGKKLNMLVFSDSDAAELKKLGAHVGEEKTLKDLESGKIPYDKIIATPSWMPKLAKVAKVLGPKGLMPNPKSGTVTDKPVETVKEFAGGKTEMRTEAQPIIHITIGKASFDEKKIEENLAALMKAVFDARPEGFKKELVRSVYISSTMGPSVKVNYSSLT